VPLIQESAALMDSLPNKGITVNILREGILFAEKHHAGQIRRFTGEPFVEHPKRVADHMYRLGYGPIEQLKAILHDVVEDTDATFKMVSDKFGKEVALSSYYLANPQSVNPIEDLKPNDIIHRYGQHISHGTDVDHTIKLCDIIDNVPSMCRYATREKAISYLFEKRMFLEYLEGGLPQLIQAVSKLLDKHEKQLMKY